MANTPIRTFRCEDEIWDALGRIAEAEERSRGWLVKKAVLQYMERYRAAKRADRQSGKQSATSS